MIRAAIDHPDNDARKSILLAEKGAAETDRFAPQADPLRLESWDAAFRGIPENGVVTIPLEEPDWLPAAFHGAATWLGLRDSALREVILVPPPGSDLREAFAAEEARHANPYNLEIPELPSLAAHQQFAALAATLWKAATSRDRPAQLGVSDRQAFAIMLYTSDFYLAYHEALRANQGDDPLYRQLLPLFALMDAGLENLPPVPGRTFRGERADSDSAERRRNLRAGDRFDELSYLSSSTEMDRVLLMRSGFLFRIEGATGRDIAPLSVYPTEKEILFSRGLCQEVLAVDSSDQRASNAGDFDTHEANANWREFSGAAHQSSPPTTGSSMTGSA